MADITMCKGDGCIIRDKCYRYTGPVNPYKQSVFSPIMMGKPCKHFWDNTGFFDGEAEIWGKN